MMKRLYGKSYIFKVLKEYVDENYYYMSFPNMFRSRRNHEMEWFYQMSYQQWAAYEILDLLKQEDEDHLVINDLEDIRQMFDDFACRAAGDDARHMFSVAEDVATEMMDLILGME